MRGGPIDSARFGSFGKRISVFSQIMGCAFQMGWAAETASQNIALERDALSEPASKGTASRFDVGTANKSRTVIWRGLEFA